MKTIQSKTIVFITGAFVTHLSWKPWQDFFERKGYTTTALPWPFKEEPPAELRAKHPAGNPGLAELTLAELIDHYIVIVNSQPEKPIVIGHSLGGLITQIIVNRDLAAAGVAIHPVPPQGIIPYEFSFLKAGLKALGLFTDQSETYLMTFEDWQYAFVNEMALNDQLAAYEANTIPESKSVVRGGLTSAAHVDFKKPHPPLLITSGSLDHIMPAHLNNRNFEAYEQNGSVTEYKEFEGRNHFVLGQPTWTEDAEYILHWLENH
jgi:pimeloyl-ACP methyl ester carboxylesterase